MLKISASIFRQAIATLFISIALMLCQFPAVAAESEQQFNRLTLQEANNLLELPLNCVGTQYPNKLNQTIGSADDLKSPAELHPIFYGCFDWHSAVHGYWSLVSLLQQFPQLEKADEALNILKSTLTSEAVAKELVYFEKEINKSWERTYGWAWLLKLAEALHTWNHPAAKPLSINLQPLADKIAQNYIDFLPNLVYPIRIGEHENTAFGLAFAFDYAKAVNDEELMTVIVNRSLDFYATDVNCPITWEPSGFDFLSPCLQEIDLMRRVLDKKAFVEWLEKFMPKLGQADFSLAVGKVGDRSDGKLVHIDGLNFSRAWVLFALSGQFSDYAQLRKIAEKHIQYSYPNLVGDSYEGGHWLGSFAIYAMQAAEN